MPLEVIPPLFEEPNVRCDLDGSVCNMAVVTWHCSRARRYNALECPQARLSIQLVHSSAMCFTDIAHSSAVLNWN